jgi:membrane protease YdiL (CAAX protease family)
MLSFPLVPAAPDASVEAAVGALQGAFPADDVWVEGDEVFITFEHNTFDLRRASAVLGERGFATNRFTMGRDLGLTRLTERMTTAIRSAAVLLLVMPAAFLIAGLVLRRRLRREQGFRQPPAVRIVAAGIGGGVALALAATGLGALLEALGRPIVEQPLIEQIARADGAMPLLMLLVAGLVLAPIGEELFYRGWVFPYLEEFGAPLAYGASTLLFAAIHFHPPAVPAYLLMGVGLAALYHWSRSIWTPILAHATNNAIAIGTLVLAG